MNKTDLKETARNLVSDSKGILAMDESFPTIKKRFEKLNIEDTEKNRQIYRDLLVTAPDLNKYISGAILFDETIKQQTLSGQSFPDFLNSINIIPGIKVDAGAKPFSCHPGEKITEGLDGLDSRMKNYYSLGARFAKWRAVINISEENNLPSDASLIANANALARYASICQENNIVPIVEPEVLMDGDHPIELTLEKSKESACLDFKVPIIFPISFMEEAPTDFIVSSQIFFVSSSLSCFGKKELITVISFFSFSKSSLRPAFS